MTVRIHYRRFALACCMLPFKCLPAAAAPLPCVPPATLRDAAKTASGAGTLGNWFAAHQQEQCAMEAYRLGISLDPRSAPLHYSLALALGSAHQEDLATAQLHEVLVLDPAFDRAYLALGVLAHNRGDRDSALRYWQEATVLNPELTVTLDWIAKTRIESGQYTEVADLVRTAPASEDLALDLVVADSKAMLFEEAIRYGEQTFAAHPEWKRLRLALATLLVQRNRFEDGLQLLERARGDDPSSFAIQVLLLQVLVLTDAQARAEPLAAQLYTSHPHDFDVLYLNGLLKRRAGDYAAAVPLLEEAQTLRPQHFDVCFNLGLALLKLHRTAEARADLMRAADLSGATPEVHFQLAAVERMQGETADAAAQLKLYQQGLVAKAAHDELISLSAQASSKLNAGDASGAAALERRILEKFPADAVHWYDLALALDATQDYEGEMQALGNAVARKAGFALALNQLGLLQVRSGEKQRAQVSFRQAIAAAPQYAEADNNLGSLLSEDGKDAEAETCFRAAVAANPREVEAWVNLAATLASEGRYGEARDAVQAALRLQPASPDATRLRDLLAQPTDASVKPR